MNIKTVTVLGANGTMGCNVSAIFASFGGAKVYMVCRSREKAEAAVTKAANSVKADAIANNLIAAVYEDLPKILPETDLVFESVAEDFESKQNIVNQLKDHVRKDTILTTGTSGLSINKLADMFPEELRGNFMGMHFFNPPYNMTLCEIIPAKYCSRELIDFVMEYSEKDLNRTVVELKDEAGFAGNRIGFQFINEALQYAEKYKDRGGIDYIDAILGGFSGRGMAPINTADFVALDVSGAIADNIYENTNDFAHDTWVYPEYCRKLMAEGKLGRKVGQGLFKMQKNDDGSKTMMVYDIATGDYRPKKKYDLPFANAMIAELKVGNYEKAMQILKTDKSEEADICLTFLLKYVLYGVTVAKLTSDTVHAADHAMATGFGWAPPLAVVDALGGKNEVISLCKSRLDKALVDRAKVDETLADIPEASMYDYRRFFRAAK